MPIAMWVLHERVMCCKALREEACLRRSYRIESHQPAGKISKLEMVIIEHIKLANACSRELPCTNRADRPQTDYQYLLVGERRKSWHSGQIVVSTESVCSSEIGFNQAGVFKANGKNPVVLIVLVACFFRKQDPQNIRGFFKDWLLKIRPGFYAIFEKVFDINFGRCYA